MDLSETQNISSPQQMHALIVLAKDAWVARDADALAQLFTPDAQLIVPGQRWQGQAKIREEIAKFGQYYTDVTITIQRTIVDGNRAAVEWHYEDTEKATGQRSYSDDAIVIEVRNGLISYWREYFDISSD
ncbi:MULTISPECIES: nuclear transport factor 2 family protein [unclassified Chamaesiphon]|uniref:nuclear transport factor 2 family protein n=1 Tax=unclassified Chamaesiphon TaxID=2620921 RepID=UPI00286A1D67|nr:MULTISPECIES: nuclear transport factor 2 family protein [unclassified Chamaesiphon]